MDSRKFELEADLRDVDNLLSISARQSIKELLLSHRLSLVEEINRIPIAEVIPVEHLNEQIIYKAIDKFAWDQTDEEVKIYVTTLGDLKGHDKNKILVENSNNSVEVTIMDFNNLNYKLKFVKLNKEIKSARVTAKSNGFSLTLKKKERGHWDNIVEKKSPLSKSEDKDTSKDPGDGLMNMMKELYENGDDDMKRTIAEAWTKAKDKEKP